MKLRRDHSRLLGGCFLAGSALYLLSALWINFHAGVWYDYDMYSDLLVAGLMARQRTLFPANWVFGNQYYVIATPALAALLMPLCQSGLRAMGLASSLMGLGVALSFVWCCRPFFRPASIAAGLFCLSGAVIVGTSAAADLCGMQLFYTMASYYACYLIGFLLHLGFWLRLRADKRASAPVCVALLLSDLAFGLQSPRETLLLNLPLVLLEALLLLRGQRRNRSLAFVLLCLGLNLLGLFLRRFLPVRSSPIISDVALHLAPAEIGARFLSCLGNLAQISGLSRLAGPLREKPLGLIALLSWALVLLALTRRRHPAIALCLLSLGCVFGVGVFLFDTRAIYFFLWFALVSLCAAQLVETLPPSRFKTLLLAGLLLCGLVNYVSNFYPDVRRYPSHAAFYSRLEAELAEEGVDHLYVDMMTPPTLAAFSDGAIVSGTFSYDFSGQGSLLRGTPHLRMDGLFEDIDPARSRVVLSAMDYSDLSSLEFVRRYGSEEAYRRLTDGLELERVEQLDYITLYFYRLSEPSLLS